MWVLLLNYITVNFVKVRKFQKETVFVFQFSKKATKNFPNFCPIIQKVFKSKKHWLIITLNTFKYLPFFYREFFSFFFGRLETSKFLSEISWPLVYIVEVVKQWHFSGGVSARNLFFTERGVKRTHLSQCGSAFLWNRIRFARIQLR